MSEEDTIPEETANEGEAEGEEGVDKEREADKGDEVAEKEKDKDKKRDKEKKSKRRSRSRSRDRDRSRRKDKDKDKDKRRSRRRSRSRSPKDRDRKRRRSPSPHHERPIRRGHFDANDPKDVDKAEFSVFVAQIHPKVDERDLFEFFSHVGTVEDIRLIRDQRTQKSKGLCYVEFSDKESVPKAIALSGQLIGGYPITIQMVEHDKQKKASTGDGLTIRLYVGNLHPNVTAADLQPVFEAFGDIEFIDLQKDGETGASKCFGFVQYKNRADGETAMSALDGLEIAGQNIKVGSVETEQAQAAAQNESVGSLDDDLGMTAQGRAALMAKLQRDGAPPVSVMAQQPGVPNPMMMAGGAPIVSAQPQVAVPRIQPTTCVVISNMFNPAEEVAESGPDFHKEIEADLREECGKYGPIKHIFVDKDDVRGRAYLRMMDVPATQKLVADFDGRWFASRKLGVEFVIEQTYFMKFPEAR